MISTYPASMIPQTVSSAPPHRACSILPAHVSSAPGPVTIRPRDSSAPRTSYTSSRPRAAIPTLPPGVRVQRMMTTVRQVASRMAYRLPRHVDVDELVGAGALGLADAFSRRGAMPGSEFEAFASYRIRGAMLDELRRLDSMPRRERVRAKQVAQAKRTVERRIGEPAAEDQIAQELGMQTGAYQAVRSRLDAWRTAVPLTTPTPDGEETVHEIPDAQAEAPDALVARAEMGRRIADGVHALPERMRAVLVGVYVEGKTLKDIGTELGVTESRVCQIHGEALAKLRANVTNDCEIEGPRSGVRARAKANTASKSTQVAQRTGRSKRA